MAKVTNTLLYLLFLFYFSCLWCMIQVIKGEFPLSISEWFTSIERHNILDFVFVSMSNFVLVLKPQSPFLDIGLFIRWEYLGISFILQYHYYFKTICNQILAHCGYTCTGSFHSILSFKKNFPYAWGKTELQNTKVTW